MPLRDDLTVRLDVDNLSIGDIHDFKELTGKEIEAFIDEVQGGTLQNKPFAEIMGLEMQALLWIALRNQATRDRVWEDSDEMFLAMQQDIRKLNLGDFQRLMITGQQEQPPAPARAKRATASQRRAAKRAAEQTSG